MGTRYGSALDLPAVPAAPPVPPGGYISVYGKADGKVYGLDSAGVETLLSNLSLTVQNEGVAVVNGATRLDFRGAGVAAALNPNNSQPVVTVSGSQKDQPAVRLYKTSAQTLTSSTDFTKITWQAAEYSVPSTFADVANSQVVFPQSGLYSVNAYVASDGDAGGRRTMYMYRNQTDVVRAMRTFPDGGASEFLPIPFCRKFAAGDTLHVAVQQNSGVSLAVSTGIDTSCFEVSFIGPA